MPELPEVETIRRGLEKVLVGKTFEEIIVNVPKLFIGDAQSLVGLDVLGMERFGKLLVFRLSGDLVLTTHLRMTGQLIWRPENEADGDIVMGGHPEAAYLASLPHKHTHIEITFSDGSELFFNDMRKFGFMQIMPEAELQELGFVQRLGPEPLEKDFTREYLREQLRLRPKVLIKSFLLDQGNIAGLGNIYADESLYRAAILPYRVAGELTFGEVHNLHEAIQETLELALMHGGSTSKDYLSATAEKGTFLKVANVYRRTGQDCNRGDGGMIERMKIGGRSSHFCPVCQR